jgi:hypothetical protein
LRRDAARPIGTAAPLPESIHYLLRDPCSNLLGRYEPLIGRIAILTWKWWLFLGLMPWTTFVFFLRNIAMLDEKDQSRGRMLPAIAKALGLSAVLCGIVTGALGFLL